MPKRTEKEFWIEMTIREIYTQAHFAELSFRNIDIKAAGGTDLVFSSIHSFLSHCSMISKMIKPELGDKDIIGKIIEVGNDSIIHDRTSRNHLEHYDERLQKWIKQKGTDSGIAMYNIGPKSAVTIENTVVISHFDPNGSIFTFVDEEFDLNKIFSESQLIKDKAHRWFKATELARIRKSPQPPK